MQKLKVEKRVNTILEMNHSPANERMHDIGQGDITFQGFNLDA